MLVEDSAGRKADRLIGVVYQHAGRTRARPRRAEAD